MSLRAHVFIHSLGHRSASFCWASRKGWARAGSGNGVELLGSPCPQGEERGCVIRRLPEQRAGEGGLIIDIGLAG